MLKTVGNPSTRYGDQTIIDGNLVIGTSGKGIDFAATPGTGTSELFDDYEEGTYVGTMTPTTSGTIPINTNYNLLAYTKIGRQVTVTGLLITDNPSSPVGAIEINLPFVIAAADQFRSAGTFIPRNNVLSANIADFICFAVGGNSYFTVYLGDATVEQADSAQQMGNFTFCYINFSYFTN